MGVRGVLWGGVGGGRATLHMPDLTDSDSLLLLSLLVPFLPLPSRASLRPISSLVEMEASPSSNEVEEYLLLSRSVSAWKRILRRRQRRIVVNSWTTRRRHSREEEQILLFA